jgi:hypothetical protein
MSDPSGSGEANRSEPNESDLPDLFAARIVVTRESYPELMRAFAPDLGCRPHLEMNPDGTATLLVYVSEDRIRELRSAGYTVEPGENASAVGRERQREVAKGDRFEGGRVTPRGLGEKTGRPREGESER